MCASLLLQALKMLWQYLEDVLRKYNSSQMGFLKTDLKEHRCVLFLLFHSLKENQELLEELFWHFQTKYMLKENRAQNRQHLRIKLALDNFSSPYLNRQHGHYRNENR